MTVLAKWLQIVVVEEQIHISTVRHNMVHNSGSSSLAFCLAKAAQWMLTQEDCSQLAPTAAGVADLRWADGLASTPSGWIDTVQSGWDIR